MRTRSLLSIPLCLAIFAVVGCGGSSSSISVLTNTPVITGVTPSPVTRGQSITISGTNLTGSLTTAYFSNGVNSATSTASSGSTTSVLVTVPTTIPAGTYNVYVITADTQGDTSAQSNSVSIQLS